MKPLRKIKITLSYFLILISFSQCTKRTALYKYSDNLTITDLELVEGDSIVVKLKNGKKRKLEFSRFEENNIVGVEEVWQRYGDKKLLGKIKTPVKIPLENVVKVVLITSDNYKRNADLLGRIVIGLVMITGLVALMIIAADNLGPK